MYSVPAFMTTEASIKYLEVGIGYTPPLVGAAVEIEITVIVEMFGALT